MSSAGLQPQPEPQPAVVVSKERLAELDRLMTEGGIEAVIKALERDPRNRCYLWTQKSVLF